MLNINASRAANSANNDASSNIPTLPSYYHKLTTFVCKANNEEELFDDLQEAVQMRDSTDFSLSGSKVHVVGYEDCQQVDMTGYLFQDSLGKFHVEFQRQSGCAILFSKIYSQFENECGKDPLTRSTSFEAPALQMDDTCAPFTHCEESIKMSVSGLIQHSLNGTPQLAIESLNALAHLVEAQGAMVQAVGEDVKEKLASIPKHFLDNPIDDERDIIIRSSVFKLIAALADKQILSHDILAEALNKAVKSAKDTVSGDSSHSLSLSRREVLRQLARAAVAVNKYDTVDLSSCTHLLSAHAADMKAWPRFDVCRDAFVALQL